MPLVFLKENIKKTHLFLSKDLGDSLKPETQDQCYVLILFLAQLLSIGSLFITDGAIGHLILIYILVPILIFPARFSWINYGIFKLPLPVTFSLYNIFRNAILCRTPLFLIVILYSVNKAFLSYLYPEPVFGYLHIFFYYLLAPILVFIVATIRLAVDQPNFYYSFFRIISPLAALNMVINFSSFLKTIPNLSSIGSYRLQSTFGAAMGYNANLDALVHAIFLVGLIITITNSKSKYNWMLSILTVTILFCALVLEQSRGCSLAVIAVLIFYGINWKSIISLHTIFIAIAFLGIILIYVFFVLPDGFSTYLSRPNYLRPEIWFKFYNLIREHSFVGFGDRYVFAIPLSNGEIAPHPHNIFMSSLVRGGIIGSVSIVYIFIFSLIRSYRYSKNMRNPVPFCVFATVTFAGIFDFDLKIWQAGWYLASYWLAIALALGADAALKNEERNKNQI